MKEYMQLCGATVERETEKALLLDVEIDTASGRKGRKIWFPKSQTKIVDGIVFAKKWIFDKKSEQLADEIGGTFYGIIAA